MYGKINGKQIKDTTVDLLKLDLSGSQGTFIYGTGSYLGSYEATPGSPFAFVTKQYADSISAGLDPKESVYLIAVTNITPNGTVSIDGVTASLGKRILLAGQTSDVDNGIYIVGPTAWTRASDSDGYPGNEVSLGNYTFVERGMTYSYSGWVLYDTNAAGPTVSVGVETQLWTQFNAAGTFIWGNGLDNIGNNIFVDISPNGGLTFSSTQLTLANYVAGDGLTLNSGVLAVGAGNGISVGVDTVSINYTEAAVGLEGNGLTASGGKINVNTSNGVTILGDSVQLDQTVAGNGLTFSSGVVNIIGSTAIGINPDSIYVKYDPTTISIDGNGALTVISSGTGSISYIVAGKGLTGSQTGVTASLDLELTTNGGLTFSGTSQNATVQVEYGSVAQQLAGNGLANNGTTIDVNTSNGVTIIGDSVQLDATVAGNGLNFTTGVIDVNTSNGVTIIGDSVQLNQTVAGNGLTFSAGVINVNLAKGVTFSGDYLFSDASTILTTANLPTISIGTNSTIQSALSAIDSALNGVGAQTEVSINNNPTGTFVKTVNAPFNMLGYTFSAASDGAPHVYINGIYVKTDSVTASSPAYFSIDSGVTGTTTVGTNSVLYLNAFYLGFKVDPTDDIVVHYLTKYP